MITAAIWLACCAHFTLWAYTEPVTTRRTTEEKMAAVTLGLALSAAIIATIAVNS